MPLTISTSEFKKALYELSKSNTDENSEDMAIVLEVAFGITRVKGQINTAIIFALVAFIIVAFAPIGFKSMSIPITICSVTSWFDNYIIIPENMRGIAIAYLEEMEVK